jgi:methionyl aminopeptidase
MPKAVAKTPQEIDSMRIAGRMLAQILEKIAAAAAPGASPKDMAKLAASELKAQGGEPAFLGFHGYPDVICISVNEQVQHSIPTAKEFVEGDVVNFDFGVRYRGLNTDGGITIGIGKIGVNEQRLLDGTKAALDTAIGQVRAGVRVGDISAAIQSVLQDHQLGIVRELVGHGVGRELHEWPEIPNYGYAGQGPVLTAGMTIAIEPITTLGSERIFITADNWTIVTRDGSKSAQFEHTMLVTDDGAEVLTSVY